MLETIVADLKMLESKGIITGKKNNLKGTLTCVSFDNLGGNVLFGFSGGFNANFYCRLCTSNRQKCQIMVAESPATLRKRSKYDAMIKRLESDEQLNLTESEGFNSSCVLNTLNSFHILTHTSVDLMHDVFEGTIGFLIKQVALYCVNNKIATAERLKSNVLSFNYGSLSKRNVPSKFNFIGDVKNCQQNASQARCLMFNLPFILYQYKEKLQKIWLAVETKLQIIQILLSDEINESDLNRLSNLITTHLQCYQLYFNEQLKPKHHFLVHYVGVIRSMGPVVRFWAMRMEAKHQYFKQIAFKTKNFINIKKTLAQKHQEHLFVASSQLHDEVERGKESQFIQCDEFNAYYMELRSIDFSNEAIETSITTKSLKFNDMQYKPGLLIASESNFFEIQFILTIENQILFLCNKIYDIEHYDSFLNSFKICCNEKITALNLKELKNRKTYEKKNLLGNLFVIVDCLTTYRMKNP